MKRIGLGLLGLWIATSGCASILGLGEYENTTSTGAGGAGGGTSTSGSTGGGSTTATTTSSTTSTTSTTTTTGAGGGTTTSSGSTGGVMMICVPASTQKCPYMGLMGTEDVGTCKAGYRVCNVDGDGYGMCNFEVQPAAKDDCSTPEDENCDGKVNDSCLCTAGTSEACYSGAAGTKNVGACKEGMHTCNMDGMSYGACMGEVVPVAETCNTPEDDDCNGQINEGGVGCVCLPSSTAACYSGPGGTQGVGVCVPGMKTCNAQGTAYLAGCAGEVVPGTENCNVKGDEDCNGSKCSEPYWTKSFQTGGASKIATDAQGNIFAFGTFSGTLVLGGTTLISSGSSDMFLAKVAPDGNPMWAKKFGDAGNQNQATDLAVDAAGYVTITGWPNGTVNFGGAALTLTAGNSGFAVARFDGLGNHIWSKLFQSATNLYCKGLSVMANGDVVLGGELNGSASFAGGPTLTSAGSSDLFFARVTAATGAHVWSKKAGDANTQSMADLDVDAGDNIVIVGTHSGTWLFPNGPNLTAVSSPDMYVARLDSTGNWACSSTIDNGGNPGAVETDPLGGIIIAGDYGSATNLGGGALPLAGQSELYLARFTTSCLHSWSKGFASTGNDFRPSLSIDPAGNIALGAQSTGMINFGGGALMPVGATYDAVVAKFTNAGVHVWSRLFGTTGIDDTVLTAMTPQNDVVLAFYGGNNADLGLGPLAMGGLIMGKFAP